MAHRGRGCASRVSMHVSQYIKCPHEQACVRSFVRHTTQLMSAFDVRNTRQAEYIKNKPENACSCRLLHIPVCSKAAGCIDGCKGTTGGASCKDNGLDISARDISSTSCNSGSSSYLDLLSWRDGEGKCGGRGCRES